MVVTVSPWYGINPRVSQMIAAKTKYILKYEREGTAVKRQPSG